VGGSELVYARTPRSLCFLWVQIRSASVPFRWQGLLITFRLLKTHHLLLPLPSIMDDAFQFIIESPQNSQGHKKRPRLVTSCDNWYVILVHHQRTTAQSSSVVSRRSSATSPRQRQNARPAKPQRSSVVSEIESATLPSEAGPLQVQIQVYMPQNYGAQCAVIATCNNPLTLPPSRSEPNPALDAFSVASGSSSPSVSSQSDPRSNSHSPKASGMVAPEADHHPRYPSYDSRHGMGHAYVDSQVPNSRLISSTATETHHQSRLSIR